MNLLQIIIVNIIILFFPLGIYLFYSMYVDNFNQEKNMTYLDFSLLSSIYLIITYNATLPYSDFIVLLNIPLMIAYIRKRNFASFFLSIIIIVCYFMNDATSLLPMISQYVLYYILYYCWVKSKRSDVFFMNCFIIIKGLFVYAFYFLNTGFYVENLLSVFFIVAIYTLISHLVIFIYLKSEDVIKLHMTMKEIEKETQYRTSLFKITHEIKNPIAVCKSYLDMFDFNNKEHKNYIPILKEEMDKILLLLQDFSSMNKIKIEKEILDINMLLEETIKQFSPIFKSRNIDFHYEIVDDEIYIEGDYNRLSQVLVNLIKNAIESEEEEKLCISLNSIINNGVIEVIINDTGSGFDMEEFDKIKEPFYTTKKNGTGLGVSLSYEIVLSHKGQLIYDSKIGKGTTVKLILPIVPLI